MLGLSVLSTNQELADTYLSSQTALLHCIRRVQMTLSVAFLILLQLQMCSLLQMPYFFVAVGSSLPDDVLPYSQYKNV